MILFLLFPLLIIGLEESQTANVTEREFGTVTMSPDNVTSSTRDEMHLIEVKLPSNETIIMDDDERFQDQKKSNSTKPCQWDMLENFSIDCEDQFHYAMRQIGSENWCRLETFTKQYSELTHCVEYVSFVLGCYYPNPSTQDFFLRIHSYFFENCTKEEEEELRFQDAPHGVVIALTLLPVGLIPILVHLVVWKSKVQE